MSVKWREQPKSLIESRTGTLWPSPEVVGDSEGARATIFTLSKSFLTVSFHSSAKPAALKRRVERFSSHIGFIVALNESSTPGWIRRSKRVLIPRQRSLPKKPMTYNVTLVPMLMTAN